MARYKITLEVEIESDQTEQEIWDNLDYNGPESLFEIYGDVGCINFEVWPR